MQSSIQQPSRLFSFHKNLYGLLQRIGNIGKHLAALRFDPDYRPLFAVAARLRPRQKTTHLSILSCPGTLRHWQSVPQMPMPFVQQLLVSPEPYSGAFLLNNKRPAIVLRFHPQRTLWRPTFGIHCLHAVLLSSAQSVSITFWPEILQKPNRI